MSAAILTQLLTAKLAAGTCGFRPRITAPKLIGKRHGPKERISLTRNREGKVDRLGLADTSKGISGDSKIGLAFLTIHINRSRKAHFRIWVDPEKIGTVVASAPEVGEDFLGADEGHALGRQPDCVQVLEEVAHLPSSELVDFPKVAAGKFARYALKLSQEISVRFPSFTANRSPASSRR